MCLTTLAHTKKLVLQRERKCMSILPSVSGLEILALLSLD